MNKIILIFLEDCDFYKKIRKNLLKEVKIFLKNKKNEGFQIRIHSTKNKSFIKKWLIKYSLNNIILNATPFNSKETVIDENIEIFSFFDFSKIFKQ